MKSWAGQGVMNGLKGSRKTKNQSKITIALDDGQDRTMSHGVQMNELLWSNRRSEKYLKNVTFCLVRIKRF